MPHVTKTLLLGLALTSASAIAAEPAGNNQTKYCLQIEASTGTRISKTECRTRAEWAELGVDVDDVVKG